MSMTRDRELADLLYASHTQLSQLKHDMDMLQSEADAAKSHALVPVDAPPVPGHASPPPEPTAQDKAMADALKKITGLHRNLEAVIGLIIKSHTDASSIINEFEKIRTAKLLASEPFALAHLINPPPK